VLGLPALFSGQPYSLTAEAVEDCVCGFVDRERALELVHKRLDLCFQAADLLAREIRSLREWQATHLDVH
jgi:CRP-like cAMP-binding protein